MTNEKDFPIITQALKDNLNYYAEIMKEDDEENITFRMEVDVEFDGENLYLRKYTNTGVVKISLGSYTLPAALKEKIERLSTYYGFELPQHIKEALK